MKDHDNRALMYIHAVLTLLAPLLVFLLVGCEGDDQGQPVDYGPAVEVSEIQKAILAGVKGIDPAATKLGAAVQYTTTQYLGGGEVVNLTSATTLTVIDRQETGRTGSTPAQVAFTVTEHRTTFSPGEPNQDVTREFKLAFDKQTGLALSTTAERVSPLAVLKAAASATYPVTFHKLTTSVAHLAPPQAVLQKPNCLGIPACTMTFNNISFDQITWKPDGPEKIHFDFSVSPQVPQISGFDMSAVFPYYEGLFKSCVTMMVPIPNSKEKVLVMECQEVQDFRFESANL